MPQSGIVKYNVKLSYEVDGLVERADIIGAIFGQTEGLLSPEMNLNELQRISKVGRIEVRSKSTTNTTTGHAIIPMSTDIDTCSLISAAVEGIDKVGPFDCKFSLVAIDDVRAAKRDDIVKRAKEIKRRWKTKAISEGDTMLKDVHEGGAGRIRSYGPSKLPCGSGVESARWVILVEGRADIINLLRSGYDNALAIQGAKIDESIIGLCEKKEKVVAFLDGDRAGGFILKELKSLVHIDVELQADPGIEVEELTPERISEILDPVAKDITSGEKKPDESVANDPLVLIVTKIYDSINGSLEAVAISEDGSELFRTPISDLVKKITDQSGIKYLILDGIITQRLYDTTKDAGIDSIVGHRIANVTSDSEMVLKTFSDLGIES